MRIDSSSQSLILAGESPEADLRFERALRLNGAPESNNSSLAVPPAPTETTGAGQVALDGFQPVGSTGTESNDVSRSSRPSAQIESPWQTVYRIVTQGESLLKGHNLDVFA